MRYIALLRGINVGGNNKVSMKELKTCFEKAGFHGVMTYINSGNVLFESDETSIEKLIRQCMEIFEKEFCFPVSLAVIEAAALKEALEHAPEWWGNDPESKHNAIFIIPPATADDVCAEVGNIKPDYEKTYAYKNIIFWSAPLMTFSHTRWSKAVGTKAYQNITIRNANTAKKLLELIQI
jgi:uncharacterized protein (DUF1697 family)